MDVKDTNICLIFVFMAGLFLESCAESPEEAERGKIESVISRMTLEDKAGLVVGMEAMNSGVPVYGIGVRAPRQKQEENVYGLAQRTLDFMGLNPDLVAREKVVANSDYVGDGYGLPTESMIEAVKMLASYEGILLDPVYSGKGFTGLIDLFPARRPV